jgi:hypothetical protein
MLGIELKVLLVVACQVHEVYLNLEFGSLEFSFATGDFVLFMTSTRLPCENRPLIEPNIVRTR